MEYYQCRNISRNWVDDIFFSGVDAYFAPALIKDSGYSTKTGLCKILKAVVIANQGFSCLRCGYDNFCRDFLYFFFKTFLGGEQQLRFQLLG